VSPTVWLVVHLVAVAVLIGVGWVVQLVVYPAFALVGPGEWAGYHARHSRAMSRVVLLPWAVQGVSVVALLVAPPRGGLLAAVVLAVLGLGTVVSTVAAALRPTPGWRRDRTAASGPCGPCSAPTSSGPRPGPPRRDSRPSWWPESSTVSGRRAGSDRTIPAPPPGPGVGPR
jgi:hypothetical protein